MKLEQEFTKIEQIEQSLLNRFLKPYQHCQYLKKAQFQYLVLEANTGWSVEGEFKIPNFFHIGDGGYFNAIEFNLCYNQLYYIAMAYIIQNNLFESMENWNLDMYQHHQLSNFLVVKFSSTFKKLINSKKFYGTLKIKRCTFQGNLIMMQTTCAFYDSKKVRIQVSGIKEGCSLNPA